MGMTIDESINQIIDSLIGKKANLLNHSDRVALADALNTMRKYQQLEDFAKWVATEVIDEELWTYNHLAFTELACRKLVKLGIMQESDGEYTYEVVEDGNV